MKQNHQSVDELFLRADAEREEEAASALWSAIAGLYRWRRFIIGMTVLGAIAAVVISLLLPNWYAASARVLPPPASSANPISAALMKNLPSAATSLLGGTTGDYARYLTILSSRRVYEKVVDRFKLVEVYELQESPTAREDAIEYLAENVDFPVDEEFEYLSVYVFDKDPKRAADMANFFVLELNRINAELSSASAANYRRFIESRYNQAQLAVDSILASTQAFQRQYGLYDVPSQLEAFFASMADMRSDAVRNEIQYEAMRSQYGADNPQVKALEDVVRASQNRFSNAMKGEEMLLPVSRENMPGVMRQYLNLQREGMIQTRILEIVGPMLEQARFEEERKVEAVQVVDQAVPPVRKARPQRSVIVVTTTISVAILSIIFALLWEWWRRNAARFAKRMQEANAADAPKRELVGNA